MGKPIKNWNDLEKEVRYLGKSLCRSLKEELSVGQILDCISEEIEESLMNPQKTEEGFLKSLWNRYRYKLFLKQKAWSPSWKFPPLPQKRCEIPLQDSILRLKTAITGFKLHTGIFNKHPLFGKLNKDEWEAVHLKVASYFFSLIEVENDRKSEQNFGRNFRRKKHSHRGKNKSNPDITGKE